MQCTLKVLIVIFSHAKGTKLLIIKSLFASAFRPTFFLLFFPDINIVCLEVIIKLKFSAAHSKFVSTLFINLCRLRACLYSMNWCGVALWYRSCKFTKEISLVQYLTQTQIALAEEDKSFCLRLAFKSQFFFTCALSTQNNKSKHFFELRRNFWYWGDPHESRIPKWRHTWRFTH